MLLILINPVGEPGRERERERSRSGFVRYGRAISRNRFRFAPFQLGSPLQQYLSSRHSFDPRDSSSSRGILQQVVDLYPRAIHRVLERKFVKRRRPVRLESTFEARARAIIRTGRRTIRYGTITSLGNRSINLVSPVDRACRS